jgi:hypothetical protein
MDEIEEEEELQTNRISLICGYMFFAIERMVME